MKLQKYLQFRDGKITVCKNGLSRQVIEEGCIEKLIQEYHRQLGHLGINKIYDIMKVRFYWPNMKSSIEAAIKCCWNCQVFKEKQPHKRSEMILDNTKECFERIGIDVCGPFSVSRNGYKYIIGVIDYYSKYPVLIPCRSAPNSKVLVTKLFRYWISHFGMPKSIHTDGATYFTSSDFKLFCEKHGVLRQHPLLIILSQMD